MRCEFASFSTFLFISLFSFAKAETDARDSIKIRNLVVKSYIVLTKSKPPRTEIDSVCSRFGLYSNFSSHFPQLLDSVMNSQQFADCLYSGYADEYIQGIPSEEIESNIVEFENSLRDSSIRHVWDINRRIIKEMKLLLAASNDFASGKISESDIQKRILINYYYDNQNMGAHNYVVSTFNFLFNRNPTIYETSEGEKFINGTYGTLFFKTGNSKPDYIDALLASDEYVESQIRYWFKRLLNRYPSTLEQLEFMQLSKQGDPRFMIKKILEKW